MWVQIVLPPLHLDSGGGVESNQILGRPIGKKNHRFVKSMAPHILCCSSQHLPCLCLRHLKGFLSWQGPSPRALLLEPHRYKDIVKCVVLGAEVPGHCQEQLTQTLIAHLLKKQLFTMLQKLGGGSGPPCLDSCLISITASCLLRDRKFNNCIA